MAKNIYHSELVKLGPVQVTVKSDILKSKFSKPDAPKPDYVVLVINGEERGYSFDTPECMVPFEGQKGQTFTIIAEGSGKDGSATVTYVGENTGTPQRKPAARSAAARGPAPHNTAAAQPQRPAQAAAPQRPPQVPAHTVVHGATVGVAIKEAVDYACATGEAWNPEAIFERASDLVRLYAALESGKLAPKFSERTISPENDGR